jgi:hypothetical protein
LKNFNYWSFFLRVNFYLAYTFIKTQKGNIL